MPLMGTTTFGIMTFCITTLNIIDLIVTFSICIKHPNAECNYAECCIFIVMMNVVMLSVVMLSVIMLSVVMLSVVMLSVVAPPTDFHVLIFRGF